MPSPVVRSRFLVALQPTRQLTPKPLRVIHLQPMIQQATKQNPQLRNRDRGGPYFF
jgi:hypothetical protein